MSVRDLWKRKDLGVIAGSFTAEAVPPHGSVREAGAREAMPCLHHVTKYKRASRPGGNAGYDPHYASCWWGRSARRLIVGC